MLFWIAGLSNFWFLAIQAMPGLGSLLQYWPQVRPVLGQPLPQALSHQSPSTSCRQNVFTAGLVFQYHPWKWQDFQDFQNFFIHYLIPTQHLYTLFTWGFFKGWRCLVGGLRSSSQGYQTKPHPPGSSVHSLHAARVSNLEIRVHGLSLD